VIVVTPSGPFSREYASGAFDSEADDGKEEDSPQRHRDHREEIIPAKQWPDRQPADREDEMVEFNIILYI
jgi:hypothetical protein